MPATTSGTIWPLVEGRHGGYTALSSMMNACWIILVMLVANLAVAAEPFKSRYVDEAKSQLAAITTNQSNTKVLYSITNLPTAIRERLAGTADAGEPFSSGCVREYASQRFLTATKVDNIYIVAIESGGIVYNWSIRGFVVNDAGKLIREIEPAGAANGSQPIRPATNSAPPAAGSRR